MSRALPANDRLAALVNGDAGALAVLNALTHGSLATLMQERLVALERPDGPPLAVLDAAVYFLLPSPPPADLVILVDAPVALRIARLEQRTGLARDLVAARVAAQDGMAAHWGRADLTVTNDGTPADLSRMARRIWTEYGPGRNAETKD